jgi:Cytochrome c554 and c-prime
MDGRLPVLLIAALASATASSASTDARCDAAARMPGPARASGRISTTTSENARCEACHEDVAREWRSSMHAQANTDPTFRRALAIEPLPFCRGCHAPEADPNADAPAALSAIGVGCVTCHVTDRTSGTTLAGHAPEGLKGLAAPHPVHRAPEFATAAACASCHEFDFPIHSRDRAPERMQSTVTEYRQSGYADVSCASCHMPPVRGSSDGGSQTRPGQSGTHKSHLFGLGTDHSMLRAAVDVSVRRTSPSRVTLLLTPAQVGHAFPTGDLFRRLVVSAEAMGDDWFVVSETSRALSRRFEMRDSGTGQSLRHLISDDRVGVAPSETLELDLGDAARGRPIAWRVEYQRVEHPVGKDDSRAVVAESVVVAEGLAPATTEERR